MGHRLAAVEARDQRAALIESVGAWALARVLCWSAGVLAIVVLGAHAGVHDPFGVTAPYGGLGNTVVGPFARWDSFWYLLIADNGYQSTHVTNFYPLYPLLARVVGAPLGDSLVGGILVSLAGSLAATYLLERLAALDLGPSHARRTMLLFAFFPTAVFFSAVYAEGVFLPLSIGSVLAARLGRWPWAGVLAGLAAITRPPGMLLLVPIALLYLYGPRADRPPEREGRGLRPRYRIRLDALWILAVPAAFGLFMLYLQVKLGDPLAMLGQRAAWHQEFTFPLVTFVRAAREAAQGLGSVTHGHLPDNIYEFGFVCLAIVGSIGCLRRLPFAYGAYAAVGTVLLLAYPIHGVSPSGFSRYVAALFPLFMWLALWSSERRLYRWVLTAFALLMVVNSARFATWHFVA
jgi:hypothetical protein